ncbi:adenylate/guanylate cyclase domain-containing protein [Dongia rigui]|uniref:Adenylate/guanylate cyclase domain-containing protein n=1 Tax=Dongia rigui TaxID=940149 RepID=A0ABU5E4F7_9PROT|nr:adenylate/guanylate cyclase domain-containing protein [Dongia rigui]MDY0874484.1 adenylate/guanylate cyclase domain-containing protein [Dongia rigui]
MTRDTGTVTADAAKTRAGWLALIVLVMLAGLPLAVWLDLTALSQTSLNRQAADLSSLISSIRSYYASNVVGRVLAGDGTTQVAHNYETIPGAIPIPATLSLELGRVIAEKQANITYRFVSDLPFKGRAQHPMDEFERNALQKLRANTAANATDFTWRGLDDSFRLVTPVVMGAACVKCHNSHPDSPKTDWKVGDVRGIQEIIITQSLAGSIFAFKYLLAYFIFVGAAGLGFILLQRQQARAIRGINRDLESANAFLASVSLKISRYLSPQIYKSIFSGQRDVVVHTERKRLTIFFSDIKDFTATTERLQPEALTHMLNEYLTEMSAIAQRHGGTLDKFIGDAVLVFFGDPETKGPAEDARACLKMAIDMQRRLDELKTKWRLEGTEEPFIVRMGINTGFCNVGNFGSSDRMDYTIIGAEANLAARLQSIAEAGQIVLSYETYALTQDLILAHPLAPITMKGIPREVVPYVVDGLRDAGNAPVVHEQLAGLDLHLDLTRITDAAKARAALQSALAALQTEPTRK